MNWEYLHLVSHSFPIVLSATGALVGMAGWLADREELERWGLLAFLVGGVFVIPAYITGLAAADVVADRTFVRPSNIQRHRTWATFAAVPLLVAAILAGFSFAEPGDRRLRRFVIVVGAAAALVTGFAAALGARIQHGDREEAEEARRPTGAYRVTRAEALTFSSTERPRLEERVADPSPGQAGRIRADAPQPAVFDPRRSGRLRAAGRARPRPPAPGGRAA